MSEVDDPNDPAKTKNGGQPSTSKAPCPSPADQVRGTLDNLSRVLRMVLMTSLSLAVIVIILAHLGTGFLVPLQNARPSASPMSMPIELDSELKQKLDAEIVKTLDSAKATAQNEADEELGKWISNLKKSIDPDFLDWYFGYFNQQRMGMMGLYDGFWHWMDSGTPTAEQKFTESFQEQFASQVLRPEIAELQLKLITEHVVALYVKRVQEGVKSIPGRYNLPPVVWEQYLSAVSRMGSRAEGNREVPILMKSVVVTSSASAARLAVSIASRVSSLMAKIGSKVVAKVGMKMGAKGAEIGAEAATAMAEETGAKVAAKFAGKFAGPIAMVALVLWDVWDHHSTVEEQRPLLKRNLFEFLDSMRRDLLLDPLTGVMSVINGIEAEILSGIETSPPSSPASSSHLR